MCSATLRSSPDRCGHDFLHLVERVPPVDEQRANSCMVYRNTHAMGRSRNVARQDYATHSMREVLTIHVCLVCMV